MMQVTLSDPIIEVTGWTPDLDKLGAYTYRRRKTPEEIREEKIERRNRFGEDAWKVSQIESIPMTCLSKDEAKPGVGRLCKRFACPPTSAPLQRKLH